MAVFFASAAAVLFVLSHIYLTGVVVEGDADASAAVLQKVSAFSMSFRDPRLDEKVEELTIALNVWGARSFIHAQLCILVTVVFHACLAPTLCSLSRLLLFGLLYANSHEIRFNSHRLSLWRIRTMYFSVMAVMFVRALLAAWSEAQYSGIDQLDLLVAVGCGVASLSVKIASIPFVMIFVADSWVQSMVQGSGWFDNFLTNGFRCFTSICLVMLVEQLARVMLMFELDAQEALQALRDIVRCSVDAEVLLDSQFRIRDRVTSLALLLHHLHDMTGMSFLDLLADDETTHQFLDLAQKSIQQASGKQVAPGARLSLKRSSGGQARGDVYVVHIPDRFGQGSRYLIGFVEDPEASGVQPCDARLSVDRAAVAKSARRFRLASSASASSSQSRRDRPMSVTSYREIVDISLFLDGQTECFDIKEARVRFTRFPDRPGMPTLKHMLNPSEWQATLPKLREAVWSGIGTGSESFPQTLGPLHIRLPEILAAGNQFLLARSSQLRLVKAANINQEGTDLSAQPIYLCLQLYNFVQLDRHGRPLELGTLSEFTSEGRPIQREVFNATLGPAPWEMNLQGPAPATAAPRMATGSRLATGGRPATQVSAAKALLSR
ncbi:unnamed protein product [Symbiodinium sp. KB8]|nr:unnamed protein product [Symbiodinium sp. KB8]